MTIAIDAHRLVSEPFTSGASYLSALLRCWADDDVRDLILLLPSDPRPSPHAEVLSWFSESLVFPSEPVDPSSSLRAQVRWNQIVIPRLLRGRTIDCYFSPFHLTPLFVRARRIVTTVHDLCFLSESVLSVGGSIHRAELATATIRAHRLICPSRYTLAALAGHSTRAARKATMIWNGVDVETLEVAQATSLVKETWPALSGRDFIMWIGALSSRKNPQLVMDTVRALRSCCASCSDILFLVMCPRGQAQDAAELALSSGAGPFEIVSDASAASRDALLRLAHALLFPSECEGFGFPAVEAMRQGCPVTSIAGGAVDELTGGLVQHSPKPDPVALALLVSEHVHRRRDAATTEALVERSLEFDPRRCATETLEVLRGDS